MKLSFDPRKDLVAVAGLANFPNLMVTAVDSPYKSIKEVIAAARQQPGKQSFGSSGPGTSSHLAGELLKIAADIDMIHVPYKGSGAVYPDLMSGRVNFLFDLAGSAVGQVQGGKLRALATTSNRRSAALPDVPAIAESGFPVSSSEPTSPCSRPLRRPRRLSRGWKTRPPRRCKCHW